MELLDKIDMMLGERQASKKRKRDKKKEWERKQVGVKKGGQRSKAQRSFVGMGSIKDLANEDDIFEGTDDFTGIVTKSLPFYMKGVKVSLMKRGNTFYARTSGGPADPVETEKFKNKDDALKWFSGFGIKEITWDKGKGKAKF